MKKIFIVLSAVLFILIIIAIILTLLLVRKPQNTNLSQSDPGFFLSKLLGRPAANPTPLPITDSTTDLITNKKINPPSVIPAISRTITSLPNLTISNLPINSNQVQKNKELLDKFVFTGVNLNSFASSSTKSVNVEAFEFAMEIINNVLNKQNNNIGNIYASPSVNPTTSPEKPPVSNKPPAEYNGMVYYSQEIGDYSSYPLPNGCDLRTAGCGPTTGSMILSSYIDKKYNPGYVVDLYGKNNYYLGCDGSGLAGIRNIFADAGLKISDYIFGSANGYTVDEIADQMKSYIKAGWTIFVLANFRPNNEGGHYFWIVDVDENNNVWAFDPAYGSYSAPPFNENTYYPFPKYIIGFGVKK